MYQQCQAWSVKRSDQANVPSGERCGPLVASGAEGAPAVELAIADGESELPVGSTLVLHSSSAVTGREVTRICCLQGYSHRSDSEHPCYLVQKIKRKFCKSMLCVTN